MTSQRLAILGGDQRQLVMMQLLKAKGYEVAAWGIGEENTASDWRAAVKETSAVLLPIPASTDGVRIHCPLEETAKLRFTTLAEHLPQGIPIIGGKLPPLWIEQGEKQQLLFSDITAAEDFQMRNALPTVEGAISLAMQAMDVTLSGTPTAVLGYGRIASLLAERLAALGSSVTVLARKPRDLLHAELRGIRSCSFFEEDISVFREIFSSCRVIFNTVPEPIFLSEWLSLLPKDCVLIELASFPGGFDQAAVKKHGLRFILGSALPGKLYPKTAGEILAKTVLSQFSELFQS